MCYNALIKHIQIRNLLNSLKKLSEMFNKNEFLSTPGHKLRPSQMYYNISNKNVSNFRLIIFFNVFICCLRWEVIFGFTFVNIRSWKNNIRIFIRNFKCEQNMKYCQEYLFISFFTLEMICRYVNVNIYLRFNYVA